MSEGGKGGGKSEWGYPLRKGGVRGKKKTSTIMVGGGGGAGPSVSQRKQGLRQERLPNVKLERGEKKKERGGGNIENQEKWDV